MPHDAPAPRHADAHPDDDDAAADQDLTIVLPRLGLARGSRALLAFAVSWNLALVALGTAIMVGAGSGGSVLGVPRQLLPVVAVLYVLCFGIGAWALREVIRTGFARGVIDVVADSLLITVEDPFGAVQEAFTLEQIVAIEAAPDGSRPGERPKLHLRIRFADTSDTCREIGMFAERPDAELLQIAGEINAALRARRARDGHAPLIRAA